MLNEFQDNLSGNSGVAGRALVYEAVNRITYIRDYALAISQELSITGSPPGNLHRNGYTNINKQCN